MNLPRRNLGEAFTGELATLWTRAVKERGGLRWTVVRRVRELTGIEQLESCIDAMAALGIAEQTEQTEPADDVNRRLESALDERDRRLDELATELDAVRGALQSLERRSTFTEWVSSVPLRREPLITVILATLGQRPAELRHALESIANQSYRQFEVVVVSPVKVLDAPFDNDPRFREVRVNEAGIGRARNLGLADAKGEYVTYADDDNAMGPQWLRAIAWCLSTESETDVVYGARLYQHEGANPPSAPAFWWFEEQWDPSILERYNPIDTCVLAHRAGMAEAVWDEKLPSCVDWDLAIRLTATGRVRPLPIRACTYMTASTGRITALHNTPTVRAEVQRRASDARRLRVLGVTHSFPRFSEFYVESELTALGPSFDIAVASEYDPFPGAESAFPRLGSVAEGIAAHRPDLVLVHFADVALRIRPLLEAHQIPYAVRVHSYDLEVAESHGFADDELCLGLWVYPQHHHRFSNAQTLSALVHDVDKAPHFAHDRSGVVFTSACLPKRRWEVVADILGSLAGMERTAILATCHGSEDLVAPVVAMFRDSDPRIQVRVDIPNPDVMRSLANASALLYASATNHPIGNPRSIVEAWLCGAIPVVPDDPLVRTFVGDHGRYYSDASQAAELIRTLNAGGPDVAKERLANMDHAYEFHGSAAVLQRFSCEVRDSYNSWSRARE